jgi:hypothetical protein
MHMTTQSHTPISSEYKRLNNQELTEAMAAFFKTEHCLITRACQPPKIYQPCTDMLPRTMSWLAAGVPMDFIDRVDSRLAEAEELPVFLTAVGEDAAIEQAGISGFDMAQVPDPS